MRRLASLVLVAGLAAVLATDGSAGAAPWCGGQYDYNCDYYNSSGKVRHCYAWVNWECADPTISFTTNLGGDCDGGIDVACNDHGLNCTLWRSGAGCVIGL